MAYLVSIVISPIVTKLIFSATLDKVFLQYGIVLQSMEIAKNIVIPENFQSNCNKSGNTRSICWKKVKYLLTIDLE